MLEMVADVDIGNVDVRAREDCAEAMETPLGRLAPPGPVTESNSVS